MSIQEVFQYSNKPISIFAPCLHREIRLIQYPLSPRVFIYMNFLLRVLSSCCLIGVKWSWDREGSGTGTWHDNNRTIETSSANRSEWLVTSSRRTDIKVHDNIDSELLGQVFYTARLTDLWRSDNIHSELFGQVFYAVRLTDLWRSDYKTLT